MAGASPSQTENCTRGTFHVSRWYCSPTGAVHTIIGVLRGLNPCDRRRSEQASSLTAERRNHSDMPSADGFENAMDMAPAALRRVLGSLRSATSFGRVQNLGLILKLASEASGEPALSMWSVQRTSIGASIRSTASITHGLTVLDQDKTAAARVAAVIIRYEILVALPSWHIKQPFLIFVINFKIHSVACELGPAVNRPSKTFLRARIV